MTVEPIRDKVKIKQMYQYLNGRDHKYGLIFKFGLNTGLRISDILPLKVKDIFLRKGVFYEYLVLKEKKTKKEKRSSSIQLLETNCFLMFWRTDWKAKITCFQAKKETISAEFRLTVF